MEITLRKNRIDRISGRSDDAMKCRDYLEKDSQCARGIPVAPLFGHYFCSRNHEDCPFHLWVKTLPDPANVVRPRKPTIVRVKT